MKRFLSAVLALGALAAPASAQPGAQKEDQARMQGTWVLIGGRLGGPIIRVGVEQVRF